MNSRSSETAAAPLHTRLTRDEKSTLLAVIGVFMMRMLGLFMLLPVLALYAASLPGATPLLVGMAVGAYGISQALLQIPFGWASDRYGRRRMLVLGLLIFGAGALVAAFSSTIGGVIAGRILQGAGAISAVLTAVIGDSIQEQRRTRAMAFVGVSIGASFMLSLMLGPMISSLVGVNGLFFVATGLAVLGLLVTVWRIPGGKPAVTPERLSWSAIAGNGNLWRLNLGIFLLHLILAALFVALPFVLRDQFGLVQGAQWKTLGLIILLSIPGTVLLVLRSERTTDEARAARFALPSIALIVVSMSVLALSTGQAFASLTLVVIVSAAFFSGFNFMEANLPARVSVVAPDQQRGTALGVFASSQFLGVFAGGALAGLAMGVDGPRGAFLVSAVAAVVWLVVQLASLPPKGPEEYDNVA